VEQDIGAVAVSEDGPIMSPWVCRAAFQRAVGKIFYHAGFEDFQPSALEAVTDVASDFFGKLIRTFTLYNEVPKDDLEAHSFSAEEQVLHCLHKNGLDLESLETYVKDDVERLGSKLGIVHERMKAHLADLLVSTNRDSCNQETNLCSGPLWATVLVQTVLVHLTTAVINSPVVTLPPTLMKISSASRNSVWLMSLVWRVSASHCICYRTACTAPTRPTIPV
jgi:hypothetical protein